MEKYSQKLRDLYEQLASYHVAGNLIYWDMTTGGSKKGMDYRVKLIGVYALKDFEISISEEMKECLDAIEANLDKVDEITKRMYVLAKKDYNDKIKIPKQEAKDYAELQAKSEVLWEKAKEEEDYNLFKGSLGELIEYNKKFIKYRGFEGNPYNTLLDDYEEGMTVDILDEYFTNLKAAIIPLVQKVTSKKLDYNLEFLSRDFPIDKQKEFCLELLKDMGFDFDAGMVKESVHPFTMALNLNDVRLTIKYIEDCMTSALFSAAHEGGHAIYEQNIDDKFSLTGLDKGVSSGIHESQSRLYENMLCRSKPFWTAYYPKLKEYFPEQLSDVTVEDFYAGINKVENSFIRIEADELTYSLHIIIRYEIEKAIINNEVTIDELPKLWNEKVKEYLGLDVPSDGLGILQDVHWSSGAFGYFPTYSIGSAYAAQFMHALEKAVDVDKALEEMNFEPINEWLRENIHQYGSFKTPKEIIASATGEDFDSKYYIDYLTNKYSELYNL